MKKGKIGILTTYYANFGSYFQATALQKAIESLGYEVELINEHSRMFKSYKMFLTLLITPVLPQFVREKIAKMNAQYYAYLRLKDNVKQLNQSSVFKQNLSKLSREYDAIVVGSDELWSANKKTIAYLPNYFGIGINCKHITYGPSATMFEGGDPNIEKEIKEGLRTFERISVRDTFTHDFVKKMIGVDAQMVIDPTLLMPYFSSEGVGGGKYVLVYGQHYNEHERKIILDYANEKRYKVCAVAWNHEWCDEFIDVDSAEGMQKAFAESEYCFPSTFHGVIFSYLNKRNFTAFINPLRGRKVTMLLKTLGLEERIYSDENNKCFDEIDFETKDAELAELRRESFSYLDRALGDIVNDTSM